jgi:hypothetical protein
MVLTFYFFISWLMLGLLFFHCKDHRGVIREVLFLFLLSCLINSQTYLGFFETLKWMKTTTEPKLFIAFLLFRSVFIPLLLTCLTLLIHSNPLKKKLIMVLLYLVIILTVDIINLTCHLYVFKEWNHLLTLTYYLVFLFFMWLSLKWFKGLKE